MKATTLLTRQHRKVEAIFKKLENGRVDPMPLLEELSNDLAAHMAIEQEIFYPAVKAVDEDLVLEAFEEHSLAELALKRLLATGPEDTSFKARVVATKELIEHHVKEEEGPIFKLGKTVFSKEEAVEIGERFLAAKQEYIARQAEVRKAG